MSNQTIYQFSDLNNSESQASIITDGPLSQYVNAKHCKKYDRESAQNTQMAVRDIFASLLQQAAAPGPDTPQKSNTLLVGKVQSGKTSNLEYLSALAFDNGFNLQIIYGGYTTNLLAQTVKRFREIFDACDFQEETDAPIIFTSDKDDPASSIFRDDRILSLLLRKNSKVILCLLKNPKHIKKANALLRTLKDSGIKTIVFDDEGDQASLNIAKKKIQEMSATYEQICEMKRLLGNPIYCTVTATPHANIFLNEFSKVQPSTVHLLHPGEGYCGAEVFHLQDNSFICEIPEDTAEQILTSTMPPDSLRDAVRHFILASVLIQQHGIEKTDMIVHVDRRTQAHARLFTMIDIYITELGEQLEDAEIAEFLFGDVLERYFTPDQKAAVNFRDESFLKSLKEVLELVHCVEQNNVDARRTRETAGLYYHNIYIGADLLQRGLTFDHLVTTFFVRCTKGSTMDTTLQRARWFGYRKKYLNLCKMFTTTTIAQEYVNLAYMEDDLWRQFAEVEAGQLSIKEIVVLANDSQLKPASKTKVDYKRINVHNWLRQKIGVFDQSQLVLNNKAIDAFLEEHDFDAVSMARSDDEANVLHARVTVPEALGLFENLQGLYNGDFDLFSIRRMLDNAKSVAVVQMSLGHERERSFYDGTDFAKIKALQQGRSSMDEAASMYKGDAAVIDSGADITVQIYKIVPTHKQDSISVPEKHNTQYMFAIYSSRKSDAGYTRR